jgi:predicted esterase
MSKFASFQELQQQIFEYHGKPETQQAAYDLMTEAVPYFPEQSNLLYNWRYCAAALLGKPDLALEIMRESIDAGFWWGEDYLRSDEDLESLQDLPEFNLLVEESEQRRQVAQAEAKPIALTLSLPADTTQPLPLLLALHGNNQNAQNSVAFWENAVEQGWLTVLLQSSQVFGPDKYVWNNLELGADEINAHYQQLCEEHQVDPAQVVISGFSKGGEMAIWLALKEVIPLAGFIAVNPGGPLIQEIDNWLPLLENYKSLTDLRGFFVVGERDASIENIKALHEMLNSHGLECKLVISQDIAHDFPENFSQILAQALEFIQGR